MAISQETMAIVAATFLGPIFAVSVSIWREAITAKYTRRLHVFRTLMSTRRVGISLDHVNAINLVEVDFYNCRKVEAAWNSYKSHLNDSSKPEDEAWHETKERLLAKLLFEIAAVLGFKIAALDIFKGATRRRVGRTAIYEPWGRSSTFTSFPKAQRAFQSG